METAIGDIAIPELVSMGSGMNCPDWVPLLKPLSVFVSLSFMLEVVSAWQVGWSGAESPDNAV